MATKALIALRAYQVAAGDLPDSLSALVPAFLETVPIDPYDGKPLRYSKARRWIWAVGPDLTDNGGTDQDPWCPDPTIRFEFE